MKNVFVSIYRFYAEGFKDMTWGRQLWWFFFEPVLSGKSEQEKIEHIGNQLTK